MLANTDTTQDQFHSLMDHLPAIVWTASAGTGEILEFNDQWSAYTGMDRLSSAGWRWIEACPPGQRQDTLIELKKAFSGGQPFGKKLLLKNAASGDYRWVALHANPMREQGQITKWIGLIVDIHQQILEREQIGELQQQLIESKEKAESASSAKSTFLANMSHEIRTPLGAIVGFAELLQREDQSQPERLSAISIIKRNGDHLARLVNEILDLSKIEAGHLEIEQLQFDISEVLDYVRDFSRFKAREKGIDLKFSYAPNLPRKITTDPTRLRQILLNLIGNAIKFTNRGEVEVSVDYCEAGTHNGRPALRFTIRDTGVGLTEAQQRSLFRPFVQADSSMNRKYGGTGLGLALSRKLARALGGDVYLVQSTVGQGSTFLLEICAGQTCAETTSSLRTQEIIESRRNLPKGLNILLAEDSEDNQILIQSLLKPMSARITVVDNGAEAVEAALRGNYDLILMDIQMPKMNGYEAVHKLRAHHYKKPIVALTAHALKEDRELAFRSGFDDHLTKPINRQALNGVIAHYTAKSGLGLQ
jgi:PAS domain S-box-containing protein